MVYISWDISFWGPWLIHTLRASIEDSMHLIYISVKFLQFAIGLFLPLEFYLIDIEFTRTSLAA